MATQPAAALIRSLLLLAALAAASGCITQDVWKRPGDGFEIYGAVPREGVSLWLAEVSAKPYGHDASNPLICYAIYSQPIHTDLAVLRFDPESSSTIIDLGSPPEGVELRRQALLDWAAARSSSEALDGARASVEKLSGRLVRLEANLDDMLSEQLHYDALLVTVLGYPAPETHPDVVAVAVGLFPEGANTPAEVNETAFTKVDRVILLPTQIPQSGSAKRRATFEAIASTPLALASDALVVALLLPTAGGGSWAVDGLARGLLGVRRDSNEWPGEVDPDRRALLQPTTRKVLP